MKGFDVDNNSKIPFHHQIYLNILQQIKSGYYKVNDKLPSEPELQEFYKVSRITVRSAMQELEREGYIKKFRGIGTIVCEPKMQYNLKHLTSFSEDNIEIGENPSSILLKFDVVIPSEKISTALNLASDEKVYYIERKRLRGDVIVGLHKTYIRQVKNLELKSGEFGPKISLYELLRNKGIVLKNAVEVLEARLPTADLCKILEIGKHQPVFYRERITYQDTNEPLEYVEMYYRADMYRYMVSLDVVN